MADMAGIEKAPLLEPESPPGYPSSEEAETLEQQKSETNQTWAQQDTTASRQRQQYNQRIFIWPVWFRILAGMFGLVTLAWMATVVMPICAHDSHELALPGSPVKLEAHIMSKCPDAKDCLEQLVLPAMEQVSADVNFTLSYIGTPTDGDDGVDCQHGPEECLGNMLELCAAKLYPDPKIYLGFTMCMSKHYEDIPQKELVKDCALEHGISFENLNSCASDERQGLRLLKESVMRSKKVGAQISCTVRLDDKVWCVRDDGKWKDCKGGHKAKDLVSEIKKLKSGKA